MVGKFISGGASRMIEWTECVYGYMIGKSLALFEQHLRLGWGGGW